MVAKPHRSRVWRYGAPEHRAVWPIGDVGCGASVFATWPICNGRQRPLRVASQRCPFHPSAVSVLAGGVGAVKAKSVEDFHAA